MVRLYGWNGGGTTLSNKKIFRLFCQYLFLGYKKIYSVVVVWVKIINTKFSVLFWRLLDSLAVAYKPIFLPETVKVKFEPSLLEKTVVYEQLPCSKNILAHMVTQNLVNCSLVHAKSILWNMRRTGDIYTFQGVVKKV